VEMAMTSQRLLSARGRKLVVMTRVPVAAGKNIRNVAEGNELSALRADFSDRIYRIYRIF
ncbi:MAG: hypothetical protein U9N19_09100, partial [Thermodesulfobacteriota bacterium]|nr:hypothetical protein [Thermodesulfobacteriota bacterium]